jgi:hypothetical protein
LRQESRQRPLLRRRRKTKIAQHALPYVAAILMNIPMPGEQVRGGNCVVVAEHQIRTARVLHTAPPRRFISARTASRSSRHPNRKCDRNYREGCCCVKQ